MSSTGHTVKILLAKERLAAQGGGYEIYEQLSVLVIFEKTPGS